MRSVSKSANERMLAFLSKTTGANTFTVKQGRRLFGVENVTARIAELRRDGHPICTSMKRNGRGEKTAVYCLRPAPSILRKARS